jgi:hypothetical protein
MLRLFIFGVLLTGVAIGQEVTPTPKPGTVVLKAGTEFSVTLDKTINSDTDKAGEDRNFHFAAQIAGNGVKFTKSSQLFGRIVETQKHTDKGGLSRVVVMFDFIKVGEGFYSVAAEVLSVEGPDGVKCIKSKVFVGGTELSTKSDILLIESGNVFNLKLLRDLVAE